MEHKQIKEYIEKTDKKYKEEYSKFVQHNAIQFYNIACVEISKIQRIQYHINIKNNYEPMEINNSFEIAQQFFNMHKIKINLKDMYDRKILVFYNDNGQRNNQYFGNNSGPTSYQGYNEERGNFVDIILSNNIMDAFAIVHEVTHYMNQPTGPRSLTSDMLTEGISYGIEFIFAQSLINDNFMTEDAKLFIYNCQMEILEYAYKIAPIYRILHVYKNFKKINENNYNKIITNGNYQNDISEFENYMKSDRDYIRDTWNFLGKSISVYFYNEYRKDKNFVNKIIKLNDAINFMSFDYCLQLIDIRNLDDMFYKITDSLESNNIYMLNGFKII